MQVVLHKKRELGVLGIEKAAELSGSQSGCCFFMGIYDIMSITI